MVYWIDPEKKAALEEAMRTNKAYPVDENIDKDFYNVREIPVSALALCNALLRLPGHLPSEEARRQLLDGAA